MVLSMQKHSNMYSLGMPTRPQSLQPFKAVLVIPENSLVDVVVVLD